MLPSPDALGDWRGLHGTHYHLIYALWLLICDHAQRVAFYEGNDLRVQPDPAAPPQPSERTEQVALVPLAVRTQVIDVWVQLKATTRSWSTGGLCADNLLANFIVNAITSARAERPYVVRLASQGRIDSKVIDALLLALDGQGKESDINHVAAAMEDARDRFPEADRPEPGEVTEGAREVLNRLRGTEPAYGAALEAEVERDLALLYPDRDTVLQIKGVLMYAILRDSAGGPYARRAYDQEWLTQPGVPRLRRRGTLDEDPVEACAEALRNRRVQPRYWNPGHVVRRAELADVFNEFLNASQTLCVVTGPTGAGVSWGVYDWALTVLTRHVRLLIPGTDLRVMRDLATLVASRLSPLFFAPWVPDQYLGRLLAAAGRIGHGPFVVIIDGIPSPPTSERAHLCHDLAKLVADCCNYDIKLVLSCEQHIWEAYELGADIPLNDLFLPPGHGSAAPRQYQDSAEGLSSIILGDLTPEEFSSVLRSRLPEGAAEAANAQLQGLAFSPLRNVSLLSRYLDLYRGLLEQGEQPPVPVVDDLLDESVKSQIHAVAQRLHCPQSQVERGLDALVARFWNARPRGLSWEGTISCLGAVLQGQDKEAYDALVDVGLITLAAMVDFVDAAIAARLFARRLLRLRVAGDEWISELRPDEDGDVAVALVRGADNPILIAESLQAQDERWLKAIVDGLAQCRPGDLRILALLTVLARAEQRSRRIIRRAASAALGELAARDDRAYRWIETMYQGEREPDQYRGAEALATTFNLAPVRTGAAVRHRLGRLEALRSGQSRGENWGESEAREREVNAFMQAITPLQDIRHPVAARVASGIIADYESLAADSESAQQPLSRIRTHVALVLGEPWIEVISNDLDAPDAMVRTRAAMALRSIAFERPLVILDTLCHALVQETDPIVIKWLLWAAHRLTKIVPARVLDAVAANPILHWDNPSAPPPLAALVLFVLAACAGDQPQRVSELLPRQLDAYPRATRDALAEPLSYAWWCCANRSDEALQHLGTLCQAALASTPMATDALALRGAVIAQVGLMCMSQGHDYAAELRDKATGSGPTIEGFLIDTDDFAARHGSELAAHPSYRDLEALLLTCIDAADRADRRMRFGPLHGALFSCAQSCLTLLAHLIVHRPDVVRVLKTLPQEWQALYVAERVLNTGRSDDLIVAYVDGLRQHTMHGGTAQAFGERRHLLVTQARVYIDPAQAFAAYREGLGQLDIGGAGVAYGFAALTDGYPNDVLRILDYNVRDDRDLPILYRWEEETRAWRSLLIARVYARMFDMRPIDIIEARELITGLQAALTAIADAPLHQDYVALYGALTSALDGHVPVIPSLRVTTSRLGQAHAYAASLLEHLNERNVFWAEAGCTVINTGADDPAPRLPTASEAAGGVPRVQQPLAQNINERNGATVDWLLDAALDGRGLWETGAYSIGNGSMQSHGGASYLYYVFPSVRLALVAIAHRSGLTDPVATVVAERMEVDKLLEGLERDDDVTRQQDPGRATASSCLDAQSERTPRDERVWYAKGDLALRQGDYSTAEVSLDQCIILLSTAHLTPLRQQTRAGALYDLACVYAQTARPNLCKQSLTNAFRMRSFSRHWMRKDPDLVNVRPFVWFQHLCRVGLKRRDSRRRPSAGADHRRGRTPDGGVTAPWDRWRWHRSKLRGGSATIE